MKSILTFLFTVLSLSAYSQTLDSISVIKKDSSWYLKRITAYEDGSEDYTFKSIGDSLLIVNYLTSMSYDAANKIAVAGATIATKFQTIKLINSYNNALKEAGLPTVLQTIQKLHQDELSGNWKSVINNNVSVAEVFVNDNGVLKIKIEGVTKNLIIFAKGWLRINNYPTTGENTDLFGITNNIYFSADKDVILKR